MSVPPPQTAPPLAPPPPPSEPPHVADGFAWWSPFAAFFVASAAGVVFVAILAGATGHAGDGDLPPGVTLGATFIQDVLLVVAMIGFAKLTQATTTPAAFGLRRTRIRRALLMAGLLMAVFYVFLQAWSQLDTSAQDDLASDLGAKDSTLSLVAVMLLVAVVAPLVEELFFRGFLFAALSRIMHWVFAAIVGGVLFGGIHASGTPAFFLVPLMLFGFGLCVLYRRTGSLLPGMGVHAFNNALALAVSLHWTPAQGALAVIAAPLVVVSIAATLAE